MGSHSVTCHLGEMTFLPLLQLVKAGTWFCHPWSRWYICPKTVTHPSTNRAQRIVTSFSWQTMLPLRPYTRSCVCVAEQRWSCLHHTTTWPTTRLSGAPRLTWSSVVDEPAELDRDSASICAAALALTGLHCTHCCTLFYPSKYLLLFYGLLLSQFHTGLHHDM